MPFVTLEGIEGSGKSTQARRLASWLGPDTLLTQEPGGTEIGRAIRGLLLDHGHHAMAPAAEVLLFFADRAQHVAELVRPALLAGHHVVSDRYTDSSLAYQGYGRGIDRALILAVARLATEGLQPDLTILLDLPVEVGLARAGRRGPWDRLEAEVLDFHERVRVGYLEMAAAEPARWVHVDADGQADDVARRVLDAAASRGLVGHHAVP
ncbi:MAG TPA: dTMP kinase [Vicinamibacteria bacterium]|nr:dTMP kinase [Vicinamibacteria bacterium]